MSTWEEAGEGGREGRRGRSVVWRRIPEEKKKKERTKRRGAT